MKLHIHSLLICLMVCSTQACGSTTSPDRGGDKIFEEVIIKELIEPHATTKNLSIEDKEKLLSAKLVLTNFFDKLQNANPSVMSMLSTKLREKYKDNYELFNSEFSADEILSYKIFDYRLGKNQSKVEFRYFLTEMMEGSICTTQRSIALVIENNNWLIYSFNAF